MGTQENKQEERKEEEKKEEEQALNFDGEEENKKTNSPEPFFPGDTSSINPPHQDQCAGNLFDPYNNEEETEKISFTSMLEKLGQYIYVFCKFNLLIKFYFNLY